MNRSIARALLPVLLLPVFCASSCSGPKTTVVAPGGTATVSLTLVADSLPANPSILSFKVSILGITLTPTSGAALTFQPPSPIVIDLMRLQSDTALLGTLINVPSGSYTIQFSLSIPQITFLNATRPTFTPHRPPCSNGAVCSATFT